MKVGKDIFTVKGLKTFMGMEWEGFNATLYMNNKKVAFVINEGNGGMYNYDVLNKELFAKVEKIVEAMPPTEFEGTPLEVDMDVFMGMLCDEYETNKKLKAKCKKGILVRTPDCKEGEFYVHKAPIAYTKENRDIIKKKFSMIYKDFEIINDRFL